MENTHGAGIFDFLGNAVKTIASVAPAAISTAIHLAPLLAFGLHIRHVENHMGLKHHLTPIERKKYVKQSNYVKQIAADGQKMINNGQKMPFKIDMNKVNDRDKAYLFDLILRLKRIISKLK